MLLTHLKKLEEENSVIKTGVVGSGRMGTGAICQISEMVGINTSIIADIDIEKAILAYKKSGWDREDITVTNKLNKANETILSGKPVVTEDAMLVPETDIDIVLEGTGNPDVGAKVAFKTINEQKHIVMLNVETDVVVGYILHKLAQKAGVIYTVSSGDEPGLINEQIDRYRTLGFEIIATGKSPTSIRTIDLYATPETVKEEAEELGINPKFLVTFRDATKTMIEMACVSNSTGLVPDIRGMHGPVAGYEDITDIFCLKEDGGILNKTGIVDYARPVLKENGEVDFLRSITPGIFVIATTDNSQIKKDLHYLSVIGSNSNFLFYTPYHLVPTEIPLSIVRACIYREPTIVPNGFNCEVIGAAKKDLEPGEVLDGGGGFTVYALNDCFEVVKEENLVPFGLLDNAKVVRKVNKDQLITYNDVEVNKDTTIYHLRKLQEEIFN